MSFLCGDELKDRFMEKKISECFVVEENGLLFTLSSNKTTIFGHITPETGLVPAPIKLELGNSKYGRIHIELRHGRQITRAGFNSIEAFVEYVARNYNRILEGRQYIIGNGTHLLQLQDSHNNTLYIELIGDKGFWRVNSGGIFRKGYGKDKKVVWSASEVQKEQSVAHNTLLAGNLTDNTPATNGTVSQPSNRKVKSSSEQNK